MGRKDKGRRYAARATYGAEVTRQPEPGSAKYSYVLVCSGCGWKSNERHGSIDTKAHTHGIKGSMGRFDCETCRQPNSFSLQESNVAQPGWTTSPGKK